ncbi:hypothetical protein BH24ACT4_BH24ACT4_16470 [soil metagenome]
MSPVPPPRTEGLHVGGAQYPAGPPQQWPAWVPPIPGRTLPDGGPPPRRSGDRKAAGLVAAAAAVALLLIVGVVAWATDDGGNDEAVADESPSTVTSPTLPLPSDPASPTTPSIDPSIPGLDPSIPGFDPTDPGFDPFEDARPLEEVLPGLIDFVEVTRGHRFRAEPVVEALDDAAFGDRFRAATAGEEEQVRAQGVGLRALGVLAPDDDPVAIREEQGEENVLGFYDPQTEELVVRGDQITPYVETIIVHELTHALDEQYFDLERGEALATRPDESGFGFLALTEGSARRVQVAYEDELDPTELLSAQIEAQLGGLADPQGAALPVAYQLLSAIPYGNGAQLVDAVVADGGNADLDAAFREPPTTSEQVLDPTAYEVREPATTVEPPAAPGPIVTEGSFGAVDLRLLSVVADPVAANDALDLSSIISPTFVLPPMVGFGGGGYVTWEDGGQACIRLTATGDSAEGAAEIRDIVETWAGAVSGVTVEASSDPLGGVSATRCA